LPALPVDVAVVVAVEVMSIEPVFGHTKHNRKIYRLNYRGRALVRTEWRLAMLTHNLTKLHRHQLSIAPG